MSAAIITAVYDYLAAEPSGTSFREAVTDRYYHLIAPDGVGVAAGPVAIYAITGAASPIRYMPGFDEEEYTMQFDIFVDDRAATPDVTALGIDEKLRSRLDRAVLTVSGYDRVRVLCTSRGVATPDAASIRVSSQFSLRGFRT